MTIYLIVAFIIWALATAIPFKHSDIVARVGAGLVALVLLLQLFKLA